MSKGSVLTTLASIAAFGLSGCTGFIADQIVKPQNSRVADMFTGYRETLLTAGIEPVDFETSVGTISAYQWQARPIELATQTSISENDDGSFQGSFVLKFNWDPNEPPDVESLGTIVLLHGHAMSKEPMMTWASLFVDAGFDAVVPDLPGHGASVERPVTFGAVESLAIGELVEQLKGQGAQQPIILFGVSLGASTAVLAAADSEAISAVIGISPYDDPRVVIPRFRRWAPWWAKL
ncbi:MAG: alpha/beta fold hydrolase, partial [Pseudomonadota bacterium]